MTRRVIVRASLRGRHRGCWLLTSVHLLKDADGLPGLKKDPGGDVIKFFYDAEGNRVVRDTENEDTVYVGADYEASIPGYAETVHFTLGGVRVGYRTDETLYVTVTDQVGSLRASYNTGSETVARQHYEP